MAKKKSFSIGRSLSQALTDTIVAANNYAGDLHVEVIPLRKVELDPQNPRNLSLSFVDLYTGINQQDEDYARKVSEKDNLKSLVHSIKEQGIINPIVVYKYGEKYRLIAGERRTLGSIIAGKEDIPAKILTAKPSQLKISLLQWIENIEREDLTLWERIRNLEKIFNSYADENKKSLADISATEIGQLLGCSLQQAVNYKAVIECSDDLKQLIKQNHIKNIEKAALLARAPRDKQEQLLAACLAGATLKELKALMNSKNQVKPSIAVKDARGRLSTQINFGTTKNINVAKKIIESTIQHNGLTELNQKFSKLMWNDYKAVTEAFKHLIKMLEASE